MNSTFYTTQDNFKAIVESKVGTVAEISQISTGWTNFVFDVKTNNGCYIFRFPRNTFFAGVLEKEVAFSKYIRNKIKTPISHIDIGYDKARPFTMHKKISGRSLTEAYGELTKEDKVKIAKQVAEFIYELQNVNLEDFTLELPTTSQFLADLSHVDDEYYDFSRHDNLVKLEQDGLVLNHADLNPGNILLDKNNNVCAVLDFAFVSYSSNINDVSRLIGRLPADFHHIMLKAYNNRFNTSITMDEINKLIDVWNYVEEHYINYMRVNQPEIDIGR